MAWRVANSLEVLLDQVNRAAPHRNKASDGSIGDVAHASRESDHNPTTIPGMTGPLIVTARDYTHDMNGGLDCNILARDLVNSRDSRIKYIIWNKRILNGKNGPLAWQWRPYGGTNPHTKHLHLSVVRTIECDRLTPWAIERVNVEDDVAGQQTFPFEGKPGQQLHHLTIETRSVSQVVGDVWFAISSGYAPMRNVTVFFNKTHAPIGIGEIPPDTRNFWEVPDGCESISWQYECDGPSSANLITGKR